MVRRFSNIHEALDPKIIKRIQDRLTPADSEVSWNIIRKSEIFKDLQKEGFVIAIVENLIPKHVNNPLMKVSYDDSEFEVDGKKFKGQSVPGDPLINYTLWPDGMVTFNENLDILDNAPAGLNWSFYLVNKDHKVKKDLTTESVYRLLYAIRRHIEVIKDAIRKAEDARIDKEIKNNMDELW